MNMEINKLEVVEIGIYYERQVSSDLMNCIWGIKNTPASEDEIKKIEKSLKLEIPDVYRQFLLRTNGMVYNLCVLYGTDDIVDAYVNNQLAEYAPGYLSIGNDNGDRELIIKANKKSNNVWFYRRRSDRNSGTR